MLLRTSYLTTPLSAHATPTPKALLFIQNTRRSDGHDGVGKFEGILQSSPSSLFWRGSQHQSWPSNGAHLSIGE